MSVCVTYKYRVADVVHDHSGMHVLVVHRQQESIAYEGVKVSRV